MARKDERKVYTSLEDLPTMLTPYDLRDFLGIGQRQTYQLINREDFPKTRNGPHILIPKWLLIKYIEEKARKGEAL